MIKFSLEKIVIWISYLTVEIYWPNLLVHWKYFNTSFDTKILYQDKTYLKSWYPFGPSLVIKVFGFGLGFSWKHSENPKMKNYNYYGD